MSSERDRIFCDGRCPRRDVDAERPSESRCIDMESWEWGERGGGESRLVEVDNLLGKSRLSDERLPSLKEVGKWGVPGNGVPRPAAVRCARRETMVCSSNNDLLCVSSSNVSTLGSSSSSGTRDRSLKLRNAIVRVPTLMVQISPRGTFVGNAFVATATPWLGIWASMCHAVGLRDAAGCHSMDGVIGEGCSTCRPGDQPGELLSVLAAFQVSGIVQPGNSSRFPQSMATKMYSRDAWPPA